MESINLTKIQKYYNFVNESTIEDNIFKPGQNANGFFIAVGKTGPVVSVYGDAKKHVCMKSRNFVFEDSSKDLTVNGIKISDGGSWIKQNDIFSEAFVKKEGKRVKISFATKGYVCVNNNLISFEGIKLDSDILLKSKDGKNYIKSREISKIFLNGEQILFETDGERHFIPNGLTLTENFYLEMKNGHFCNVSIPFSLPPIYVVLGQKSSLLTENFRCSNPVVEPLMSDEKKEEKINFTVTRYNDETITASLLCNFVTLEEYNLSNIVFDVIHESQETKINYGIYPSVQTVQIEILETPILESKNSQSFFGSLSSIANLPAIQKREPRVENLIVTVVDVITNVCCTMKDGSIFHSKITRSVQVSNKEKGEIKRYIPGTKSEFISDEYFVLNGNDLRRQKGSKKISIVFTEEYNSITLYNSETQTWTEHEVRQETLFSKKYIKEVYTNLSPTFHLSDLGWYDQKDTFKYFINGTNVEKLKYYIDSKKSKVIDGKTVLEEIKISFSRQQDKKIFETTVLFVLNNNLKTSYILEKDENSFKAFQTITHSTYGGYILDSEELYVFQNKINGLSEEFKTFPIFNYIDQDTVKVRTCSLTREIKSMIIDEDFEIKLTNNDYIRLNHCSDVRIKNSILTVPRHTSFCVFSVEGIVYFIKSSLTKNASKSSFSGVLERRRTTVIDSLSGSFKTDPSQKPSAEPEKEKSIGDRIRSFSIIDSIRSMITKEEKPEAEKQPEAGKQPEAEKQPEVEKQPKQPKVEKQQPEQPPKKDAIVPTLKKIDAPVNTVKKIVLNQPSSKPNPKKVLPPTLDNKKATPKIEIEETNNTITERKTSEEKKNEGKTSNFESNQAQNIPVVLKKDMGSETLIYSRESQNIFPLQNYQKPQTTVAVAKKTQPSKQTEMKQTRFLNTPYE